jgi:hypothetical protein
MFIEDESSRGMSPQPIGVPLASVSPLTVNPGSVPVWWSSTPGVAGSRPNVGPIATIRLLWIWTARVLAMQGRLESNQRLPQQYIKILM